jgi:predicted DNA-binding transcriptional regulator YafY
MLETSARLLQLLSLLQVRREWTGPALAERIGVTERTVRRDVGKLRSLGYPINASPGVAGGYQLGAGAQLPPLRPPSGRSPSWNRCCREGCGRSSACSGTP